MNSSQLRHFMTLAIQESRKCVPEEGKTTATAPLVGAVAVKDNREIGTAYRGKGVPGDHAEMILIREVGHDATRDAVFFTTLEPCNRRNPPNRECVAHLIEAGVRRVYVGMLDPNPDVRGDGILRLREAHIEVETFPPDLMSEIEHINVNFIRHYRPSGARPIPAKNRRVDRSLDEWYRDVNRMYWEKNFFRDANSIFAHLSEVVGGLSQLASKKHKKGVSGESYIPKVFAWWMALCGKVGIRSLADMIWTKFPNVCPYCQKQIHDNNICLKEKAKGYGPDWDKLGKLGELNIKERPASLAGWQRMFAQIYPAQQTEEAGPSFARLSEELGELAEAVRVFALSPGYFLSEAADVFAWLMHIANVVDQHRGIDVVIGDWLQEAFYAAYPDMCKECRSETCSCPPILMSTVGRIAHELPPPKDGDARNLLTASEAITTFRSR